MKAKDIKPLIFPVAIVVGGFIFGRKLLEMFNFSDTKEEKKTTADASALEKNNYWNPSWANDTEKGKYKNVMLLSSVTGDKLATDIYNSKGYFNDDEDALYGVFNALNYQTQVSSLAGWFYKKYKYDLYSYIKSFLNESELQQLKVLIDKKSLGKTK